MNINNTIREKISDFIGNYGVYNYEIEQYFQLRPGTDQRRERSIELIQEIMTAHGKENLHKYISELGRIEAGIKELEPWVRDHVSHAIHCFLLGIFINEYYLKDNFKVHINTFQWKLTSLFHDIGYPVEIAQNLLKPYNEKIDEIRIKLGIKKQQKPIFKIAYDDLIILTHSNSLTLIQNQINSWDLKIDVKTEYKNRQLKGIVCHGIISSLLLLKVIDLMYESINPKREYRDIYTDGKNINWNQHYFDNDVIPACTSIFIHNLPISSFKGVKIDPQKAPLAFLLKLADTLQDWERPSKDLTVGLSSDLFDLVYEDTTIVIKTRIDQERIDKINNELNNFLAVDNIRIEKI